MRIEQLEYLVDIAKTNSINVSAERLYVTQPAISDAVHKLEEELGILLLERSKRGVKLTKAGVVAVDHAQQVLAHLADLRLEVTKAEENYDKSLAGNLQIGAVSLSNNIILPNILGAFYQLYPQITINSFVVSPYEMNGFLLDGVMNVGILNSIEHKDMEIVNADNETILSSPNLRVEKMFSESVSIIAHQDFAITREKIVSITDVLAYPLVMFGNHTIYKKKIMQILSSYGQLNVVVNTDNLNFYKRSVLNGVGVGLFSPMSYGEMFDNLPKESNIKIIPLKENLKIVYYTVYAKDKALSPQELAFINHVKAYMKA